MFILILKEWRRNDDQQFQHRFIFNRRCVKHQPFVSLYKNNKMFYVMHSIVLFRRVISGKESVKRMRKWDMLIIFVTRWHFFQLWKQNENEIFWKLDCLIKGFQFVTMLRKRKHVTIGQSNATVIELNANNLVDLKAS